MTRPSSNPGYFYYDHDIPYEWRIRTITFYTSHQYIRRGDDFVRIDVPDDMKVSTFADQLLFAPRYSEANVAMATGEEAEEFVAAILKMVRSHNRHSCADDVLLINHGESIRIFKKSTVLYGCPAHVICAYAGRPGHTTARSTREGPCWPPRQTTSLRAARS
jgi:hypothetical protein